jgi:hypothetical protein
MQTFSHKRLCCLAALAFCSVTSTHAQGGGGLAIVWHTIDGGGGTSTGRGFSLSGTIGQPDAGTMSGGSFTLQGGFWASGVEPAVTCLGDLVTSATFQPPPDGQVDGADLAFLLGEWGAVSGGGSPADIVTSATFQPPPDGLVDGADLAVLLGAWGACE